MTSKVGLAVIGLGRISQTHIDAIQALPERCELVAVADLQEELAYKVATQHQVTPYTSVDEVLQDERVEGVVICLPHNLHAPISIQAAEAGRHVLVEKVMARTHDEGVSMVEAAKQNSVKLMVGQSRRYFLAMQEAHRRREEIGRIYNLLYTFAPYFDINVAPPWWRRAEDTGGLVYPMLGSHSIDYALWMLDDRRPVAVFAKGASNNPDFEGDDDVTLIIEFDDGTHATNFLSINNRSPRHEGLIVGEKGSIYFIQRGDHDGLIGIAETDLYVNGELVMSGDPRPHSFTVQMKEFLDSIDEDREPSSSGERILAQLSIIEAAQVSAQKRRMIELP